MHYFIIKQYIFYHEMFGSAPTYDILTSRMRSSYTPWYKMEISRMGENRRKSCQEKTNHLVMDRLISHSKFLSYLMNS